jgi:hypothetical protein
MDGDKWVCPECDNDNDADDPDFCNMCSFPNPFKGGPPVVEEAK